MTDSDGSDVKPIQSLSDLELDAANANLGTDRGEWALRESLMRFGVGRGVLADRKGRLIGGNKTREALEALGDEVQVVTVQTTGDTLVVTQRVDLDLEDEDGMARELAFADNRVGELNLAWDAQKIAQGLEQGLDLAAFFHQHEVDALLAGSDEGVESEAETEHDPVPEMEIQPFEHYDYIAVFFRNTLDWAKAVDALGIGEQGFSFTAKDGTKHRKIGLCRAIDGKRFLEALERYAGTGHTDTQQG